MLLPVALCLVWFPSPAGALEVRNLGRRIAGSFSLATSSSASDEERDANTTATASTYDDLWRLVHGLRLKVMALQKEEAQEQAKVIGLRKVASSVTSAVTRMSSTLSSALRGAEDFSKTVASMRRLDNDTERASDSLGDAITEDEEGYKNASNISGNMNGTIEAWLTLSDDLHLYLPNGTYMTDLDELLAQESSLNSRIVDMANKTLVANGFSQVLESYINGTNSTLPSLSDLVTFEPPDKPCPNC